jgi:TolB-like protein/DNA-binding winged helix-turn-helix (wHTH) protein/cytochrome c-type biogenesis protein CcmH/NrfG
VQPPIFRFGIFELDPRSGELRKQGMKVRLQGQPLEILALLLQRPGETVTREELQKKLWPGDTFVDFEQGLNNAIKRLRAALDDNAGSPHFIETLPRHGYRFIGTVNGVELTSAMPAKPVRGRRTIIWLAGFGALAVIAVVAIRAGFDGHAWRDRLFVHATKPRIQALAVLPLANLSGDPEQEYFADGMTEELTIELGKVSAARVISRQSIMQYKGSKKPLQEIAQELNVDAILEGAVERSGNRVRVGIRLYQISPESQLWAKQFDGDIRDVLRLQDEIARGVSDEIQIKLTSQERAQFASARSVDPEAHDDYLRGRLQMAQLFDPTDRSADPDAHGGHVQLAIGYFKQAIQKEPAYAQAYAGLADAYVALANPAVGIIPPKQILPEAKAAATKALELDPSLGEAHFSLAQIIELYDWNWSEAAKEYRIALTLSPNYADAHLEYGRFLQAMGRNDETIKQMKYATELDPFDVQTRVIISYVTYSSRQYDLAIQQFETLGDDLGLGWAYREKKMYPEATAALQRCLSKSRDTNTLASLADVYGLAGRKGEALKLISELKERAGRHYVSSFLFAEAYGGLGEKDQALAWLERAYEDRDQWMVYIASYPGLDPLRSEPRFQALLRRMNFAP